MTSVDNSGRTDGLYAANYIALSIMVVSYLGIVIQGTRGITTRVLIGYLVSFLLFFPVTTFINDIALTSGIAHSTFTGVMRSATYWLCVVLVTSTILLVYYGVRVVWFQFLYPEFIPKKI